MSLSLAVSIAIFCLIAVREWLPAWLKIWHIMTAGAAVMLVMGEIAPKEAVDAIDWDVIVYLFAVFSIGTALFQSGISHRIADRLAAFSTPATSLTAFIVTFAILAAILTNDAAAVIGTPIAFVLANRTRTHPRIYLIGLCATVTIGSMATPIGNPQNLIIAESGDVAAPVFTFFLWLIVPTVISLLFVFWWLLRSMKNGETDAGADDIHYPADQPIWPYVLSGGLLVLLVVGDSLLNTIHPEYGIPLGIAALVACVPSYLFGRARLDILKDLDWPTLVFFVAMFVVTGALLQSGSLQSMLGGVRDHMHEPVVTAVTSFVGSQVFSNVPLVTMYLQLLDQPGTANLMMLSAISTLAGNVFIISAASNVIVVQQADQLGRESFTFWQFSRAVLPIAVVSTLFTFGWIMLWYELLS